MTDFLCVSLFYGFVLVSLDDMKNVEYDKIFELLLCLKHTGQRKKNRQEKALHRRGMLFWPDGHRVEGVCIRV